VCDRCVATASTATVPDGKIYTVPEVAAILRVHKSTVYRDVGSGRCGAYRVGKGRGTVRIPEESFIEYRRRGPSAADCDGTS